MVRGVEKIILRGKSMKPLFQEGEILAVERIGREEIKRGNVVTFRAPQTGQLVAHRVIEIGNEGVRPIFITKGDNSRSPDVGVYREDVLGRVIGKFRNNELVRINRFEEIFFLKFAGSYRNLMNQASRLLCLLTPILYRILPIRYVVLGDQEGMERRLAVVLGKIVGERSANGEETAIWIHRFFSKTDLKERI